MTSNAAHESNLAKLIDEQLEIAAAKLPALAPTGVTPSPADHEERKPHTHRSRMCCSAMLKPHLKCWKNWRRWRPRPR
jgi:hypothetical protein